MRSATAWWASCPRPNIMPTVPDIHRRGTRAAQATIAAPPLTVGTLYFVTDESTTERWNGTAWESYGDAGGVLAPGPHAATHASGGSDPVTVTTLAGYPGGTTTFLRSDGTFATPTAGAPSAHHTTHETGGTDAITALAGSVITSGTIASARLGAHATTHQSGGSDPLALDTLAVPTDITTLNASTSAHGLLRKLSGTATQYLDGSGAWSTPGGAGGGGAAWMAAFTAPSLASFSWVNQGTGTGTETAGKVVLVAPALSGDNLRILEQTLPGGTTYNVTTCFTPNIMQLQYNQVGVCLRESGTGKIAGVMIGYSAGGYQVWWAKFNSPTSYNTSTGVNNLLASAFAAPTWFRISRSGSTLTLAWSPDGLQFRDVYSEALTAGFTTAPDRAGVFASSNHASSLAAITLVSWAVA